jgi:hypothetical protein
VNRIGKKEELQWMAAIVAADKLGIGIKMNHIKESLTHEHHSPSLIIDILFVIFLLLV